MKKLKVGVIGTGGIADYHLRSYQRNPQVEITAVCDINHERAMVKATEFGIPRAYGDVGDLLASTDIDAVSVVTWTNTHQDITIAALNAGKHVLCEKPPALSAAETCKMQAAAAQHNKLLMFGFVRRFAQNTQVLKEYMDHGKLGNIYYAKAGFLRRCGSPGGWFADGAISGGGPLIDLGIHIIDLSVYLMGKPRPVSVFGNTYGRIGSRANIKGVSWYKAANYGNSTHTVEDFANAIIKFDNGASLFIETSWAMNIKVETLYMDFFGDIGGARLEPKLEMYSEEYNYLVDIQPVLDNHTFDFEKSFQAEIDHFIDCVVGNAECICPAEDGVTVMKIIDAIYESSRTGDLVKLL